MCYNSNVRQHKAAFCYKYFLCKYMITVKRYETLGRYLKND